MEQSGKPMELGAMAKCVDSIRGEVRDMIRGLMTGQFYI